MAQVTGSGISVCQPGSVRANPGIFTSATRQDVLSLAGLSSEMKSQHKQKPSQKMGGGEGECHTERETDRGKHLALMPLYEHLGQAKPEANSVPYLGLFSYKIQ